MPDIAILAVFIPTFFFVSITPGMCMTLAMTLGISIGFSRTLWMMLGEILGVATVALLAILGIAKLFLSYPDIFVMFKYIGGAYLIYLGYKLWVTPVQVSIMKYSSSISNRQLAIQGFITAIANPKGWAFMIALLPPFIDQDKSLTIQLAIFILIIGVSEFVCMCIYASGGKSLSTFLNKSDKRHWINRIGGALLAFVGIWLAVS